MEKQELKSKWDDLARELGAEISSEIQQREEAASQASQTAPTESQPRGSEVEPAATLPKRNAPGWDSLASDFGLPIPEPAAGASDEGRQVVPREEPRPAPRTREREREE